MLCIDPVAYVTPAAINHLKIGQNFISQPSSDAGM